MTAARTARRSGSTAAGLLDALAIATMVTVASLAFGGAYGGARWLVAAAGGAVVGALTGWLAARLRWAWWVTAPACAVAYLLFGAALAVPGTAIGGVLPGFESLRLLTVGAIASWRQLLTVTVPVGTSGTLMIPAYLTALLAGAVGASIAVRSRRPRGALLAILATLLTAALFGASTPWWPVMSGLGVAIVALLWTSWLARRGGAGGFDPRRPLSAVVVLAAAIAAGFYLGPQIDVGERYALRETVQPPFDPQQYPSPLVGFRKYFKDLQQTELFTVTGLPAGARIRLAAMDTYDGVSFATSSAVDPFRKVGDEIAAPDVAPGSVAATVDLTIDDYRGVFLPIGGSLSTLQFDSPDAASLADGFRYSSGNATGVVASGIGTGDSYRSDVYITPGEQDLDLASAPIEQVTLPSSGKISDDLKSVAGKLTEQADTPYQKVLAIQKGLADHGFLSHGDGPNPSASGHGLDRLSALVADKVLIGDQEQFAPAMALMLRSLGIPARVVMGFAPAAGSAPVDGGSWTVHGGDATAWVEVPFTGIGWVAFDPTPDDQPIEEQPDPPNEVAPRAQVLQPPPPPQPPQEINSDKVDSGNNDQRNNDQDDPPPDSSELLRTIVIVVLWVVIPLVLIGGPIGLVLWLKARRRRRRREAAVIADRFSGGWDQLMDTATDFGYAGRRGRTRTESASDLDRAFGGSTLLLARRADERVFGPEDLDEDEAARFWADVEAVVLGLSAARGRWRRYRAAVSLRSLRHGRRVPGRGGKR